MSRIELDCLGTVSNIGKWSTVHLQNIFSVVIRSRKSISVDNTEGHSSKSPTRSSCRQIHVITMLSWLMDSEIHDATRSTVVNCYAFLSL